MSFTLARGPWLQIAPLNQYGFLETWAKGYTGTPSATFSVPLSPCSTPIGDWL